MERLGQLLAPRTQFLPVKVHLTVQSIAPDSVVTPEEQENGWSEDDAALNVGDTNINDKTDLVVEETTAKDGCETVSSNMGE